MHHTVGAIRDDLRVRPSPANPHQLFRRTPNAVEQRGKIARDAGILLAATDGQKRNAGLLAIAQALETRQKAIAAANQADMKRSQEEQLGAPLLKRLTPQTPLKSTTSSRVFTATIELTDPLGATKLSTQLDEGLDLYKVTCPSG